MLPRIALKVPKFKHYVCVRNLHTQIGTHQSEDTFRSGVARRETVQRATLAFGGMRSFAIIGATERICEERALDADVALAINQSGQVCQVGFSYHFTSPLNAVVT